MVEGSCKLLLVVLGPSLIKLYMRVVLFFSLETMMVCCADSPIIVASLLPYLFLPYQ
eukprot:gnl/Chilomastix_caulleri/8150.p1 GENE.gnl/Chilomastix_caulleri/8150~~gnl/Chilomastix_caulleri/8150.p1  ORF type:complete len:57 (-),score=3.85 gnl/Chilomastix_caulleri/8150:23-193(-)